MIHCAECQLCGGRPVRSHPAVGMLLQRGSGDHGRDRAFHDVSEHGYFACADDEQQAALGSHDGVKTDGDGRGRDSRGIPPKGPAF